MLHYAGDKDLQKQFLDLVRTSARYEPRYSAKEGAAKLTLERSF